MSSSIVPRKHARESSSGSVTDSSENATDREVNVPSTVAVKSIKPARKRAKTAHRQKKQGERIQIFQSRKDLENLDLGYEGSEDKDEVTDSDSHVSDSDYLPTSPAKLSVIRHPGAGAGVGQSLRSNTTSDELSDKLDNVSTLIKSNDLGAAHKALSAITKTKTWQSTASRESVLQVFNFTQLLGDGKKQGLDQAKMINDLRRKLMETEAQVKELAKENAKLRVEME